MQFKLAALSLFVAVAVAAPCDEHDYPVPAPPPVKVPTPHRPTCKSYEFFYGPKNCCLPHGGPKHRPSPPSHKRCPPRDWYWNEPTSCCVPFHAPPSHPSPPTCDNHWRWNDQTNCCEEYHPAPPAPKPPVHDPRPHCKSSEFSYGPRNVCLPHGGPSHFPSPPAHKQCPSKNWYWHEPSACCVPFTPSPPAPTCGPHWLWNNDNQCCEEHDPKPTPVHRRPGHDYPIRPIHYPKARPTKTTTVTVTVTPSPTAVSQCNTSGSHCCNQVQSSTNSDATKLLDAYGIKVINPQTNTNQTNVGINCSPISGTGATCVEQPVCCQNNNFSGGDGAIIIGCSPVNIYINGAPAGSI